MKREPQIGWWIADLANLISISCAVIAQVSVLFIRHHSTDLTSAGFAFIAQIGHCFGGLALAWIVVGVVFATICRVNKGTANEAIAYVALLGLAIVGVVTVLVNTPST